MINYIETIRVLPLLTIVLLFITFSSCDVGYKNDGTEVTWRTWNESSGHRSRRIDADPASFEKLKYDYGRDKLHAFYEGNIIGEADGSTFHVLDEWYAVDKSHVFRAGKLVEHAAPSSFKVHSYYLAEDSSDFFWKGRKLNVHDKSSFKLLGKADSWRTSWAKDRNNGYYLNGSVIYGIDYDTFHPVEVRKNGLSNYAADKYRVFYIDKEVPGADPATFEEIDFAIGKDKNRIYHKANPTQVTDYTKLSPIGRLMYSDDKNIYDNNLNIIPDADISTFKNVSDNWYKDKNHVWWSNKLLENANPKTFHPISVTYNSGGVYSDFNYGKDEKNVFYQDSIIIGADPLTFEKREFPDRLGWTVFDCNRVYEGKDSPYLREYLKKKYGR